jgi:hypothetical protein
MATNLKVKRTYNISAEVVALVKRGVEDLHAAPSQDAFVEEAITAYARKLRDARDAQLWRQAADDPEYQAELRALDNLFIDDERNAWEG